MQYHYHFVQSVLDMTGNQDIHAHMEKMPGRAGRPQDSRVAASLGSGVIIGSAKATDEEPSHVAEPPQ